MSEYPATQAEARSTGARYYFTGKPCRNGHLSERRTTDGGCKGCERDPRRSYAYLKLNAPILPIHRRKRESEIVENDGPLLSYDDVYLETVEILAPAGVDTDYLMGALWAADYRSTRKIREANLASVREVLPQVRAMLIDSREYFVPATVQLSAFDRLLLSELWTDEKDLSACLIAAYFQFGIGSRDAMRNWTKWEPRRSKVKFDGGILGDEGIYF